MTTPKVPDWALAPAGPGERLRAMQAHEAATLELHWPDGKRRRQWAKSQGWSAPRFGFDGAFTRQMFESDENFQRALTGGGVELRLPRQEVEYPAAELEALDTAYQEGEWRWLVEALREIRRAVAAGVVVQVEASRLTSFQRFYDWAHGRYHALEDDTNTAWIGDDSRHPYG